MTKKCLDGSAFEAIRVPIICEYPGLGDGPGQHASVREPIHNPAPALLLELPCSRRFGIQAVDGDDAIGVRAVPFPFRQESTYSMVVLSVASPIGAILRRPKARSGVVA